MNAFFDNLKNAFNRPNYELYQIIYVTAVFCIGQAVLYLLFGQNEPESTYKEIMKYIGVSANTSVFFYRPWTIFTYMLPHADIFHVFFNMLILYYFGQLVVEYLGSRKLLVIYILGGITGALFYILAYNFIPFYENRVETSLMIGASGGVLAAVAAAATLLPNFTFYLIFLGPVKIKYIAIFYAVLSMITIQGSNAGGELAHLGGLTFGFLYIKQLQQGNDIGKWFSVFLDWLQGLFSKQSNIKVSYRSGKSEKKSRTTSKDSSDKASQEEIDLILDKISESGYDSLSKEEKRKLFEASKK